jgi:RNA polymerase-binding transcription factor DksA
VATRITLYGADDLQEDHTVDAGFLQEMKTELLAHRARLLGHLAADQNPDPDGDMATPGDEVDVAAEALEKKNLDALDAVDAKRLKLIEGALARIDQGRYGYCLESNVAISKERLRAVPWALFTVEVQARKERESR